MFLLVLLLPLLASASKTTFSAANGKSLITESSPNKDAATLFEEFFEVSRLVFLSEDTWVESAAFPNDRISMVWDIVLKGRKSLREKCQNIKKSMHVIPANARDLAKTLSNFGDISFSLPAIEKYKLEKGYVKLYGAIANLPSLFKSIETTLSIDIKVHRRSWYRAIYCGGTAEMDTPALDADFRKFCFDDEHVLTFNSLHNGCKINSKKAQNMFNEFMHYHKEKSGLEGVKMIIQLGMGSNLDYLIPMLENRKTAYCTVSDSEKIEDFIAKSGFEEAKQGKINYVPFMMTSSKMFEEYLMKLDVEGKIAPHPVTGKLLFTKKLMASEARKLIKALKLMICMNMYVPRLALTEEEYQSANEITNYITAIQDSTKELGSFTFNKDLIKELGKVTTDISVHFKSCHQMNFNQSQAFDALLKEDDNLRYQLSFMLNGEYLREKPISYSITAGHGLQFKVCGGQNPRVEFDPSWRREDFKIRLDNMTIVRGAGVPMFSAAVDRAKMVSTIFISGTSNAMTAAVNEKEAEKSTAPIVETIKEEELKVETAAASISICSKDFPKTKMEPEAKPLATKALEKEADVAKVHDDDILKLDYKYVAHLKKQSLNAAISSDVEELLSSVKSNEDLELIDPMADCFASRMEQVEDKDEMALLLVDLLSSGVVKVDLTAKYAEVEKVKRAFEAMMQKSKKY